MSLKESQKEIRDELRMTAALCCYSIMRSGVSKSLCAQYDYMSSLYHGDELSILSNIKMMCNGSYVFKDLYDVVKHQTVTSKSAYINAESQTNLSLKVSLTRNKSRMYYANDDILLSDLEKKDTMDNS